jgi:aldehyde:ferredoxin oxidoreductase
MHAKGLEIPGYDPRSMKTMALGYAVGLRGACHNRTPGYEVDMTPDIDRFNGEPARGEMIKEKEDFAAVLDSLIICKFIRKCFDNFYEEAAYLYSQVTGLDMSASELIKTGERINNIKKAFNIREGWKREDDWLPPRVFEDPIPSGDGKGTVVTKEELNIMIGSYYKSRGWTDKGQISGKKLGELALKDSIIPAKGLEHGTKVYNL